MASRVLSIAFLFGVFCVTVQAAIITPGTSGGTPDIFAGCAGCTLVASTSGTNILANAPGHYTFSYKAAVYADPANILCAGCYDFFYQVTNSPVSTDNINRVTGVDYTGWQTDVGYNASSFGIFSAGTATPGLVDRNTADVIGWQFNAGLPGSFVLMTPGSTSVILEVQTDAKNWKPGSMNVIDGSVTTVNAFAPASGVPEPATMIMLGTGLVSLAGFRQRNRRRKGART